MVRCLSTRSLFDCLMSFTDFSRRTMNQENGQIRPINTRITTMSSTRPMPPDGATPHDLLCPQRGNAPISKSMRMTTRMVPSMIDISTVRCCVTQTTMFIARTIYNAGPRVWFHVQAVNTDPFGKVLGLGASCTVIKNTGTKSGVQELVGHG